MDVTALLQQDHRTVEGLFSQYKSTQDDATVEQICQELERHTTIEEAIVYPPGSPRSTRSSNSTPKKSTPRRRNSSPRSGPDPTMSPRLVEQLQQYSPTPRRGRRIEGVSGSTSTTR
jgi:hypothetical protein